MRYYCTKALDQIRNSSVVQELSIVATVSNFGANRNAMQCDAMRCNAMQCNAKQIGCFLFNSAIEISLSCLERKLLYLQTREGLNNN